MRIALILFIIVPLFEMIVLIEVGSIIGAIPTVFLVVLTATVGIWLLKLEGMQTWARVQQKLAQGAIPETELLEGVMLIVGGALLLTPGFVTDTVGFICLLPGLRRPIARWMIRQAVFRSFDTTSNTTSQTKIIEGEFRRED